VPIENQPPAIGTKAGVRIGEPESTIAPSYGEIEDVRIQNNHRLQAEARHAAASLTSGDLDPTGQALRQPAI